MLALVSPLWQLLFEARMGLSLKKLTPRVPQLSTLSEDHVSGESICRPFRRIRSGSEEAQPSSVSQGSLKDANWPFETGRMSAHRQEAAMLGSDL